MSEELAVYGRNDVAMVRKPEEVLKDAREAYAAGLVDGEGSIGVYAIKRGKYTRYDLKFSLKMTDMKTISWLNRKYGGSISKPKSSGNRKQGYSWQLSGKSAHGFLKKVFPFLITKEEQALLGIQFYENLVSDKNRLKNISPNLREARNKIVLEFKKMNRRGK